MVEQLGGEFDFWIVAKDRDETDDKAYPDVKVDAWNKVGNVQVYYASPGSLTLRKISRLIKETPHEILYLNSYFNYHFTILPLLARLLRIFPDKPVVLAPRGEFSKGALALKSWKKHPYIRLSIAVNLYSGIIWQASSEYEVNDIRKNMDEKATERIIVAPNLPSRIVHEKRHAIKHDFRTPGKSLKIIFLSRITPKKNLDFALKVLCKVSVPVVFDIYGTIFDEVYWQHCKNLIKVLPDNIHVSYKGSLTHNLVDSTLSQYDLCFFPTRGENFGHVIYEALAAGLPVLISDQTPWRDLQEKGIGWSLSLEDSNRFSRIIERVYGMTENDFMEMKKKAISYSIEYIEESGALKKNRDLFNYALRTNPIKKYPIQNRNL